MTHRPRSRKGRHRCTPSCPLWEETRAGANASRKNVPSQGRKARRKNPPQEKGGSSSGKIPHVNVSRTALHGEGVSYDPTSYDWARTSRETQRLPQGDWTVWLILAGRGFGKTRTGAETVRHWVETGVCRRVALVAETEEEARVVMVEGTSGVLAVCPPDRRPVYTSSRNEIVWPNGARAMIYTSESYDKLRGPQFDGAWVDELAKFRYAQEVWDQLMFSLRLGLHPRVVVTTTPRPIGLLHTLMTDPATHVTTGTSYENERNLSPVFIQQIIQRYEGTPLGRQEIHADIGAIPLLGVWRRETIRYGEVEET